MDVSGQKYTIFSKLFTSGQVQKPLVQSLVFEGVLFCIYEVSRNQDCNMLILLKFEPVRFQYRLNFITYSTQVKLVRLLLLFKLCYIISAQRSMVCSISETSYQILCDSYIIYICDSYQRCTFHQSNMFSLSFFKCFCRIASPWI